MHLKQTYCFINTTQLAENYNKMTAPINFQDPIEPMFKQIEDVLCYANAGMKPYMVAQYVNIAFLCIHNTGAIPDACREWKRRTPVNQIWADFRREFTRAQREQCMIYSTSRGPDYYTANVAEHYVHITLTADGVFVTAMANLATATSNDRETVATSNKAIATLTEQLKSKDMLVSPKKLNSNALWAGTPLLCPLCLLHQLKPM
jgi:hypothetical protein